MTDKDKEYSIKKGARFTVVYRITNSKEGIVEGTYAGMAALGTDTALVLETEDGPFFLNAGTIVSLRQLEPAPEEPKKKVDESALYG